MTSFSIQGATNDASTSIITKGASAAELLVNLTRGRHQNLLVTIGDDDEFAVRGADNQADRVIASIRAGRRPSAVQAGQVRTAAEHDVGI